MEASNVVNIDGTEPMDQRLQLDLSIEDKTQQYRTALRNFFHPQENAQLRQPQIDERLPLDSSISDKTEQYRKALRDFFHPRA